MFPNRDLKDGLPEYKSTTLPLHQPAGRDRFKPDDRDTLYLRNFRPFNEADRSEVFMHLRTGNWQTQQRNLGSIKYVELVL